MEIRVGNGEILDAGLSAGALTRRCFQALAVLSPQAPLGADERVGRNRGFARLSTD